MPTTIRYVRLCLLAMVAMLAACTAKLPSQYSQGQSKPIIYPDYQDVTIPVNIAPLHFAIEMEAQEYATCLTSGEEQIILAGQDVCPSQRQWKTLVEASSRIQVDVYTRQGEKWTRHQSFDIHISEDPIDPYISYRLIAPSYVTYEDLTICQRCLENYDEDVIYGNMINSTEQDGQCINCHAYQQGNPDRMQFHCRQALGGTIIAYDGEVKKVNITHYLKEHPGDTVRSGGVYPAWHPTEKLIAYSSNNTGQSFHTKDTQKIEVQDTYSDLILYDIDANEVLALERDTNDMDCFPWWSPDGKYLYYCSAHYEKRDSTEGLTKEYDLIANYQDCRYSLYRRPFDLKRREFGPRQMVYNADSLGHSATLPRISPDGRWLMFTQGDFGVFHIWHRSADLYLMDLHNGKVRPIKEINSDEVESYHSWSSNGKWVIFSSRRVDGNYTRPYIAHVDAEGHFGKPFELPQDDPHYHHQFMRSYNIPEFMKGPVTISPQELAKTVQSDALRATNLN